MSEDINIQYEKIFGREKRPNIFQPDDEEYVALRREILASKRELVEGEGLPFSGIKILPRGKFEKITKKTRACNGKSDVSETVKSQIVDENMSYTQRQLYIIRNDKPGGECYAIGNYDASNKKFTLQAGSLISFMVDPLYDMSMAGTSRARFIARHCSKEDAGYRLKKDQTFDSPDDAASYVLGRTANGLMDWVDEEGNTLNSIVSKRE
jgi:hypothetical protein